MPKEINLSLTVDEVNQVIEALGQMPFIQVYKLIEKIHLQANQQIDHTQPTNSTANN